MEIKVSKRLTALTAVAFGLLISSSLVTLADTNATSTTLSSASQSSTARNSSSSHSVSENSSDSSANVSSNSQSSSNTSPSKGTSDNVVKSGPTFAKPGTIKYSTVIKGGYKVYPTLGSTATANSSQYLNRTFEIVQIGSYAGGYKYYQLKTSSGAVIGFVNANALASVRGEQGIAIKATGYYTVMSQSAKIYKSFDLSKSVSVGSIYHTTLRAAVEYKHFNGKTYISLYDYKNRWIGYIDKAYLAQGKYGRMGAVISANHYATINSKSFKIYWNLLWKARTTTKSQYHKTFKVTGLYHANDGNVYEALYTQNGKFYGYVNVAGVIKRYVPQGAAFKTNKTVELTSTTAPIWKNFSWQKASKQGSSYKNKPLVAKIVYNHVNGSQYYSLYTKSNGWVGYVNVKSTKTYVAPKQYTGAFWLKPSENKPYPNLKKYPNAYFSVSQKAQRVYIKAADGTTLYTMICSTGLGNNTPNGWYKIQAERGTAFSGANYWTSWLNHGQYLFHTVIVNHDRSYNVAAAKKLGHKASHGCIRLPVPDAIWIYKNAPVGMRVHIY